MEQLICQYWYLFLFVFILGFILALFIQKRTARMIRNFINRASLVKKYWFFVIPFIIICILCYGFLFKFSSKDNLNIYITALGQVLTLIFAIFVGYFAFLQVIESRIDKLKERALNYLREKSYFRAKENYEEAYKINPKDIFVLSDLSEVYLILEDYNNFDEKFAQLNCLVIEDNEKIGCYYLKIIKFLLKQHLAEAKGELDNFVGFMKSNSNALNNFNWNFIDIEGSGVYSNLTGEAKRILVNFINYLKKKLSEEQRKFFENKNYELK